MEIPKEMLRREKHAPRTVGEGGEDHQDGAAAPAAISKMRKETETRAFYPRNIFVMRFGQMGSKPS